MVGINESDPTQVGNRSSFLPCPWTEGYGCGAGRHTKDLLATRVANVNLIRIDAKGNSAERGNGVDGKETVVAAAELSDSLESLDGAGGGLRMGDEEHRWPVLTQGSADLCQAEGNARDTLEHSHICALVGNESSQLLHTFLCPTCIILAKIKKKLL